jgi:heme exporter protein B
MNLFQLYKSQVQREIILHWRQRRVCINSCIFFLMIVTFFPLTLPPNSNILHTIAPGLIWIAMLFALFLSAQRLFQQEYDDGVIEQWIVSGYPLSIFILAKLFSHWLIIVIPMLLFCPLFALLFNLTYLETSNIILTLITGTPAILTLCALASAFGSCVQNNGILMAIIVLPLTLPIIIIGSTQTNATLALLLALSITTVTLLPIAISGIIRAVLVD